MKSIFLLILPALIFCADQKTKDDHLSVTQGAEETSQEAHLATSAEILTAYEVKKSSPTTSSEASERLKETETSPTHDVPLKETPTTAKSEEKSDNNEKSESSSATIEESDRKIILGPQVAEMIIDILEPEVIECLVGLLDFLSELFSKALPGLFDDSAEMSKIEPEKLKTSFLKAFNSSLTAFIQSYEQIKTKDLQSELNFDDYFLDPSRRIAIFFFSIIEKLQDTPTELRNLLIFFFKSMENFGQDFVLNCQKNFKNEKSDVFMAFDKFFKSELIADLEIFDPDFLFEFLKTDEKCIQLIRTVLSAKQGGVFSFPKNFEGVFTRGTKFLLENVLDTINLSISYASDEDTDEDSDEDTDEGCAKDLAKKDSAKKDSAKKDLANILFLQETIQSLMLRFIDQTIHRKPPQISEDVHEDLLEFKAILKQFLTVLKSLVKTFTNPFTFPETCGLKLTPVEDVTGRFVSLSDDNTPAKLQPELNKKPNELALHKLPTFNLTFNYLAFTLEMGNKIRKVTTPVPRLRGLPAIKNGSRQLSIFQCLSACESMRSFVQKHKRSSVCPVSAFLFDMFAIIQKTEELLSGNCNNEQCATVCASVRMQSLISLLDRSDLKSEYPTNSIQDHLGLVLRSISEEYDDEDLDTSELPFLVIKDRREYCDFYECYNPRPKTSVLVKAAPFSSQHETLADVLQNQFIRTELLGIDLSNIINFFDPATGDYKLWPSETKLKIISCEDKNFHRVKVPRVLKTCDTQNILKAFIVESSRGVNYSISKFEDNWYLIKDSAIYLVQDLDFFLNRGDEIVLSFYETV